MILAPGIPPLPPGVRVLPEGASPELARILNLPRRPVLDCDRDPETRRYRPEAQALAERVTSRFVRPPRLSCACRARRVERTRGEALLIHQAAPPNVPPAPPVETTVTAFVVDSSHDPDACRLVSDVRPRYAAELPGFSRPCIRMLKPIQAWLVEEAYQLSGIFGFLPIGVGKTIAAFLAALAVASARTVVVLGKSDQRHHYVQHYKHFREHFRVPSLVMDRVDDHKHSYLVEGAPVVHFIPYSLLQGQKNRQILESRAPDTIIADEAHLLAAAPSARRGAGSGRAGRVLRYLKARNEEGRAVNFLAWSGSLINRSLLDMTHLAAYSLGVGSPYPIPDEEAMKWADVVDRSNLPDVSSKTAIALRRAFGAAPASKVEELFRDPKIGEGLRDWAIHTPGVISAKSSFQVSITIRERKVGRVPDSVRAALEKVRGGERPDGDEFEETVQQIACARDVADGFYMYWAFPTIPCTCPADELGSCEGCLKIADWYVKRKAYTREAREKRRFNEEHLDTPGLLYNAAERAYRDPPYDGDLPVWPSRHFLDWRKVEKSVPHVSKVRWIDDYFAEDAAAWAREHRGIVWCSSVPLGEKIAKLAGIPWHGGGAGAEARILAEDGSRSIVASISSHHEGRDGLQYRFHKQYVAEPLASGKGWDQLLGRLAREGQPEDTVETWVPRHTEEVRDALRQAVDLARFDEENSPTRSLLLAADMDFDP